MTNQELQRLGEDLAAAETERRGMIPIARNFRLNLGEIDLIVLDGSTLVFVEVKTRSNSSFAEPSASVGPRKQRQIRRVAEAFLAGVRRDLTFETCRFDVVSVDTGTRSLRYIVDAF